MRRPHLQLLSSIVAGLVCSTAIAAQPAPSKERLTLGQAERLAIDLQQGMALQEVERLLGKPKRTALRTLGYSGPVGSSQDTLQWTYSWSAPAQSDRTLQVVFAGKSPDGWLVHSWDWNGY